jgi:hypothetical protein
MSENISTSAGSEQAPLPGAEAPRARAWTPSRTVAVIAVIATAALVLVGVGAWAVYSKFMGSDGGVADSAEALPAGSIMMFELSIEPSTQQKVRLAKMGDQLDGLQEYLDSTDIDVSLDEEHSTELRPAIWDAIIEELDLDTALDYDDDLAPWLGGRIAIALVGGSDDPSQSWIIAIESKDDEAGVDATETFIDDAFGDDAGDVQVATKNGYVIIAPGEFDLDDAYADGVLADQPAFASVVGRLGDRGLASYWIGTYATAEAAADWEREYDPAAYELLSDALEDIPEDAGQGAVIRAIDGGIEALSVSSGAPTSATLGGDAGAQIGALPDTTAMAFSVHQIGSVFDTMLTREYLASALLGSTGSPGAAQTMVEGITGEYSYDADYEDLVEAWTEDLRETIEDAFGLEIPEEIDAAFGSGVIAAIDSDLDCDFDSYDGDCDEPRMALVVHTRDIDATTDAMDDFMDEAGIDGSDVDYTVARDDSRLVFGAGDYVDELTTNADDSLSDLPEFRRAMPDAKSATVAMYLSVEGILDIADDAGADLESDVSDAILDFAAIGMTGTMHADGTTVSRFRIVLAD